MSFAKFLINKIVTEIPDLNMQMSLPKLIAVIVQNKNVIAVHTQCCFNVYTTSITLGRRRMNVKMTLCADWE